MTMNTSASVLHTEPNRTMTYARARLWLGITGVGTIVLASVIALIADAGSKWFAEASGSLSAVVSSLAVFLAVYVLMSLPFDVLGGYVLPKRCGRQHPPLSAFLLGLLRGATVQVAVMLAAGCLIVTVGSATGRWGVALLLLVLMLAVVAFQLPIARFVGGIRLVRAHGDMTGIDGQGIVGVSSRDEGFTGGVAGLFGFARVVVPEHWINRLSDDEMRAVLARRRTVMHRGLRTRGIVVGVVWNLSGFLLCSYLPGAGVGDVGQLVALSLWFTLWSFIGLLVLPSMSRPAVFAADAAAVESGIDKKVLAGTVRTLDQWQDDEPQRSSGVETIFHPIPAVNNRLARLDQPDASGGAWHAARMALPMSWVCLGLLGRAVHCNSGRPALWLFLPSD